jgi:hypothetical protein
MTSYLKRVAGRVNDNESLLVPDDDLDLVGGVRKYSFNWALAPITT